MSHLAPAPTTPVATTPLDAMHRRLGARMVPFAGYDMPLHYATGIVSEHLHTRAKAGLFDISHMGQAILAGAGVARGLEALCPADLVELAPERTRYTQLLNESGGVLDDLMVTRLPGRDERLFLVVNAATKHADFALIAQKLPQTSLQVLDKRAMLALQGPRAVDALKPLLLGVEELSFMDWSAFDYDGAGVYVTRSGYTGEDGFEISLPATIAEKFALRLLEHPDVEMIGLGARDSLRLEAGLCLYGHDLDAGVDPVEAGLTFSIGKRRRAQHGFPGSERIRNALENGPARNRVGLLPQGKAPLRESAPLFSGNGSEAGIVTSGGFSPSLSRPVAMGYVDRAFAAPGTVLSAQLRGRTVELVVTKLPFVPHRYVHLRKDH